LLDRGRDDHLLTAPRSLAHPFLSRTTGGEAYSRIVMEHSRLRKPACSQSECTLPGDREWADPLFQKADEIESERGLEQEPDDSDREAQSIRC
jgi:hypothetical protein